MSKPFGQLIGQWGAMAPINRMRFSSKWISAGGDLRLRGPVVSAEPPAVDSAGPPGEMGGINSLYGMAGNNPVNEIDPDGLDPESWPFIGPIISNSRLNDFARQHSDDQGNSFQDYNAMKRYFDEKRHYSSPQYQSGDIATVQGIEGFHQGCCGHISDSGNLCNAHRHWRKSSLQANPERTGTHCRTSLFQLCCDGCRKICRKHRREFAS